MGVAQRYYHAFAPWLAARGFEVLTFDYRGIGASAPPDPRDSDATISDWLKHDCATMLDLAAAAGAPVTWLGHSLGGQVLPMVPNAALASRMVMVAAGNGWWRLHDPAMRIRAALLWYLIAPPAVALAGYFPGRRLGMIGDLPAGVMRQWRRWCLHPRYAAGAEQAEDAFAAFTTPVISLSFTDDEMMSARNTDGLHALFTGTRIAHTRLSPADLGVARIGHFGAFRPEFADTLWERHLLPALL